MLFLRRLALHFILSSQGEVTYSDRTQWVTLPNPHTLVSMRGPHCRGPVDILRQPPYFRAHAGPPFKFACARRQ